MLDSLIHFVTTQATNQFFTGGTLLVILTAILASMRKVPFYLFSFLKRKIVTTVDITDHDPSFFWLKQWLQEQSYVKEKCNLLTVNTMTVATLETNIQQNDFEKVVSFSLAPGLHLLKFKHNYILLKSIRSTVQNMATKKAYNDTIVLMAFSRKIIMDLLNEARNITFPDHSNLITIYNNAYSGAWSEPLIRDFRDINSIILNKQLKSDLISDLGEFLNSKDWYMDRGIPYQRGYLFYGPPGNGKTSLICALASYYKLAIYIVNINNISGYTFLNLLSSVSARSLVIFEDIDCLFIDRENTNNKKNRDNISFSSFLNAIDGLCSPSGRILIATTNYPERLDAALMRPGRIDKKIEFPQANYDTARRLFLRFFPGKEKQASLFADQVKSQKYKYSMANLQEHLVINKNDPEKALILLTNGQLKQIIDTHNTDLIGDLC